MRARGEPNCAGRKTRFLKSLQEMLCVSRLSLDSYLREHPDLEGSSRRYLLQPQCYPMGVFTCGTANSKLKISRFFPFFPRCHHLVTHVTAGFVQCKSTHLRWGHLLKLTPKMLLTQLCSEVS